MNDSLGRIFLCLKYLCFCSVGINWRYLKGVLSFAKLEKVQAAFPTTVPTEKEHQKEARPQKQRYDVVLEECQSELIALCEQYYAKQDWRLPSNVQHQRADKLARRKVDHPSASV